VRDRLISMPNWALFLVTGLPWVAVFFVIDLIFGDSLLPALVPAAILGVVLGVGTTAALKFGDRLEKRAFGDVSTEVRREATRAVRTGPVPADPETRAVALRLAQQHLRYVRRLRPVLAVNAALALIVGVVGAFSSSWLVLAFVFAVPLLAQLVLTPRRLRDRIALLSEPQEPVLRTE
jgi:ABC-type multidrug transport system fused ATPase/permease subunit